MRRIIIFDKQDKVIVYDKSISQFGCCHTNLENIVVLDCAEENAEYERQNLSNSTSQDKQKGEPNGK